MTTAFIVIAAGKATRMGSLVNDAGGKLFLQLEEAPIIREHAQLADAIRAKYFIAVVSPTFARHDDVRNALPQHIEPVFIVQRSPVDCVPYAMSLGVQAATVRGCDDVYITAADTIVNPDEVHVPNAIFTNRYEYDWRAARQYCVLAQDGTWKDRMVRDDDDVFVSMRMNPGSYGDEHKLFTVCRGTLSVPAMLSQFDHVPLVKLLYWRDVGSVLDARKGVEVPSRGGAVRFVDETVVKTFYCEADATAAVRLNDLLRLEQRVHMRHTPGTSCVTMERVPMRTLSDQLLFDSRLDTVQAYHDVYNALHRNEANIHKLPVASTMQQILEDRVKSYFSKMPNTMQHVLEKAYEWYLQQITEPKTIDAVLATTGFMHGDPIQSNIMYDQRSGSVKFIDMRHRPRALGLGGCAIFDYAKLYLGAVMGLAPIMLEVPWMKCAYFAPVHIDMELVSLVAIGQMLASIMVHPRSQQHHMIESVLKEYASHDNS